MDSKIVYNNESMDLIDDFTDIGYMAENVEVETLEGETKTIKRSHTDEAMTLLISFPNTQENFVKEMFKLDQFMSDIQVPIHCYFLFAKSNDNLKLIQKTLQKFEIVIDKEEEFGSMYGTQIVSGTLALQLTKSLFLISKDGAVFYLQLPETLEKQFDLENLQIQLNKAFVSYTGVGCHG
jgi:peroxiredoxin